MILLPERSRFRSGSVAASEQCAAQRTSAAPACSSLSADELRNADLAKVGCKIFRPRGSGGTLVVR